jgi:hypothetical protein
LNVSGIPRRGLEPALPERTWAMDYCSAVVCTFVSCIH